MNKPLTQVLTRQTLKLLAGAKSFSRGEEYHEHGLVRSLVVEHDHASAEVHGTRTYPCKLRVSGESLQGECSCPAFGDSGLCKHLVAVGLAIIEPANKRAAELDVREEVRPSISRARRWAQPPSHEEVTLENIREYLSNLSREKLVELILTQAMEDSALLRALRLEFLGNRVTSQPEETAVDREDLVRSLKMAIDQGVEVDGDYGDWPNEYETARPLEKLLERIQGLLDKSMASEVVELSEYFIAAIEPIIERFHEASLLVDILEKLQDLHLAACTQAPSDPEHLARKLFRWELTSHWSVFENAPTKYKKVFGEKGLRIYRELASAEWEKIPSRKERHFGGGEDNRYKMTRIMENLAKASGDVEAEVAIHAKDLSHGYDYLRIAEIYLSRQMRDKAIDWAEKGLRAFPGSPDGRLREFLAREYHHLERHMEAMALIWAEFVESSSLEKFKSLKSHADLIRTWPEWREKAIAHLRAEIQKTKKPKTDSIYATHAPWERRPSSATLVEIHLWENDTDAAWNQAKAEGANFQLWYQLAQKREKSHPAEAAEAYRKIVTEEIERGGNDSYRDAVKLVGKIQTLMEEAKLEGQFPNYLEELRTTFKPKRNFIKLLDAKFGDLKP